MRELLSFGNYTKESYFLIFVMSIYWKNFTGENMLYYTEEIKLNNQFD